VLGVSLGGVVAQQLAHQAPQRVCRLVLAATGPGVGGEARRDPDALLHGSLARFIERPSVSGYFGQLYAIAGWTSMPWLRKLRQPTLVLAGDDDPIVPLINGRFLAHCIPEARLHTVGGGGHMFLLDRRDCATRDGLRFRGRPRTSSGCPAGSRSGRRTPWELTPSPAVIHDARPRRTRREGAGDTRIGLFLGPPAQRLCRGTKTRGHA
jgi:hypothetical protein